MSFSYYKYLHFGITIPLIVIGVLLIGSVVAFAYLHKKRVNIFVRVQPFIVVLCACLFLIILMFSALPFLEHLPFENYQTEITDVVLVEEVEEANIFPIYYNAEQTSFQTASIIRTNRGSFYCINTGDFNTGEYLKVTFLPYSRAVLEWRNISEQEAFLYWKKYPNAPNVSPKENYQETDNKAVLIVVVFFLLTIKETAIEYSSSYLLDWLWKKDLKNNGTITPRTFGIIEKIFTELIFLFACIYAFMVKNPIIAVLFILIFLGYGYYIAEIFSTRVIFSAEALYFKSFSTSLSVKKKDISKICWEYPRRSSIKRLTIYTQEKLTINLSPIDFIGLKNFCEWINSTGDALREP